MRDRTLPIFAGILLATLSFNVALAEEDAEAVQILQSRGADQRVDYASLTRFGPWDDRNYELTTEDLEFLASNEHELHDPIPAFFRVELRKEMPHLRRSGPAQYPRSAVPLFENRYGQLIQEKRPENSNQESRSDKSSRRCRNSKKK